MLLIGDIHIHPRHANDIIQMIRGFIQSYPDESHIIFVGDYVYHFSYHRSSLLSLLDFFLELKNQGKTLYILAGNHDRLGQHFVYAEAEKILSSTNLEQKSGGLYFITKPQFVTIQSEAVLFLPYMMTWQDSEELNNHLSQLVDQRSQEHNRSTQKLILIHHYYVAETAFPGLKVKFTYRDFALQPRRLDDERIMMISGHIHHAFTYKNYCCVGAVRSTSPSEINQLQYLFHFDPRTYSLTAQQIALNPYLQYTIGDNQNIDASMLAAFWEDLVCQERTYFLSPQYQFALSSCALPTDRTSLAICSDVIQYDQINTIVDSQLVRQLRTITIKKSPERLTVALEQLTSEMQDFTSGRGDRKQLLDDYLTQKFGDRKVVYDQTLKELGI